MNVGIVGLGNMGTNHLRVLSKLVGNIDSISVYDTNIDRAVEATNIYKANYYSEFDRFLDCVDAVIICTPTTTHYEIAKICAEKNKDILIEKPITSTIKEAESLMKLMEGKKNICMIGHIERFNPAIIYLTEYLKDKEILCISASRISKIEKNRTFDVDVVTDLMIHDIDIILSLSNSYPTGVSSVSFDEGFNHVLALLQFDNGTVSNLISSRTSHEKIRKLDIMTKDETIHVDYINSTIEFIKLYDKNRKCTISASTLPIADNLKLYFEGEPLKGELEYFIDCIKQRKIPVSNEKTGFMALSVAKKIIEHLSGGRTQIDTHCKAFSRA